MQDVGIPGSGKFGLSIKLRKPKRLRYIPTISLSLYSKVPEP